MKYKLEDIETCECGHLLKFHMKVNAYKLKKGECFYPIDNKETFICMCKKYKKETKK